uniref:ATP-dependent DNA helicase n=1 Tax=Homalodisca liturata TaxID=320908 RepID=A0A1B6J8E6_9HEMI
MTINKSQGQTFNKIGNCLDTSCSAHGQLYVAFSRVRKWADVLVYVINDAKQGTCGFNNGCTFTNNVTYTSIVDRNYNHDEDMQNSGEEEDQNLIPRHAQNSPPTNGAVCPVHESHDNVPEDVEMAGDDNEQLAQEFIQIIEDENTFITVVHNDSENVSRHDKPGTSGICKTILHPVADDSESY